LDGVLNGGSAGGQLLDGGLIGSLAGGQLLYDLLELIEVH
jgi:hypothetical protein